VLLKSGPNSGGGLFGYFKGSPSLDGQPMPEVEKALVDDAPRIVRLTIWAVIAFFTFLVLWANFAVIDEVTKGEGKAIPSTKIQKIQNLEGGIVAEIYAHDGQIVDAGAPLIRLDDTRFASNVGETEADRVAMELRVERLSAEVDDRPLNISADARKTAASQAANEESLYKSRRQQLADEVGGLQQQLIQRQQELREFGSKQEQYRNSLGLLRQEIGMSEPLVAQGAVSPVDMLRLKRSEVETRGQLDGTTLAIPRARRRCRGSAQDRRDPRQIPQRRADTVERSAHQSFQGAIHRQGSGRPGQPHHGHLAGARHRQADAGQHRRWRDPAGQRYC
jgi:adhesin transport system membrane fusion protein